jgi:hypothetical protein
MKVVKQKAHQPPMTSHAARASRVSMVPAADQMVGAGEFEFIDSVEQSR